MQTQNEPWLMWKRLCDDLHVDLVDTQRGFQDLLYHYGQTHRAYHVLSHIVDCLKAFELLRHLCKNPLAVELAIWWHDSVYDVHRKGNEENSAKCLSAFATAGRIDSQVINVARACVLATRHNVTPTSIDEEVMIDVDLAILGQPWEVYEVYMQGIRKEYAFVPRIFYVFRRRFVMKRFMESRPYIFFMPIMRARYEAHARANIVNEFRLLRLS